MELDPDVWMCCMALPRSCNIVMNYLEEVDYTPRSFTEDLDFGQHTDVPEEQHLYEYRAGVTVVRTIFLSMFFYLLSF